MAPSFDSGEFAYAADVPSTVTSTTVTPVRSNSDATAVVKLNGVEDTDGTVSLAVGENVITVEVTAEGGNTTGTYTVIVTRNNAEPAFSDTATMRTLPENSAAGTDVDGGAVTASDTDSGDTLTYGLENTGDLNSFTIVSSSGLIQAKSGVVYNFEGSKTSYTVTVTVHDGKDPVGGASTVVDDEIVVIIDLTDVNEAPTITDGPTSSSVSEDSTDVDTYTASDPDASDTLTWSVEGANDGSFFEVSSGGVLSFRNAPDFEDKQDAGANNVYNVSVTVTDAGGMSATRAVAVTVTNINEAPEITTVSTIYTAFNVDEKTATSDVIKTYEASDVDANTTLTWSLEGADRADFTIMKNTQGHGELKFANVPNYEMPADAGTDNVYDVTVKVRDNHSGQLSDTLSVVVTVDDVNEAPVVNGNAGPSFMEIEFNATSADLAIGTYSYTDEDQNPTDTITWRVTGTDAGRFTIGSSSGVLSFSIRPDFENPVAASGNNYVVVVEADDGQGGVGTFNVAVTVTNVNETPEITSNNATQTFDEIEYDATTANLEVDTFTGRDEETETITWSLGGTDAGDFSINSAAGLLSFSLYRPGTSFTPVRGHGLHLAHANEAAGGALFPGRRHQQCPESMSSSRLHGERERTSGNSVVASRSHRPPLTSCSTVTHGKGKPALSNGRAARTTHRTGPRRNSNKPSSRSAMSTPPGEAARYARSWRTEATAPCPAPAPSPPSSAGTTGLPAVNQPGATGSGSSIPSLTTSGRWTSRATSPPEQADVTP